METEVVLDKLKEGNRKYLSAVHGTGDVSPAVRLKTYREGQHPYAVVSLRQSM